MIRSNAIRNSARNQACTLNIAGVCNYDSSTTVFAHISLPGGHGMGLKADDICGCYACSSCHDAIDGRSGSLTDMDWHFYALRGLARTMRLLWENNIISIKGAK